MTEDSGYLLDNRQTEAGERSEALGQLLDGSTFRHFDRGFRELLAERGADLSYGRKLPRLLGELSLDRVEVDAYFPVTSPAATVLEAATVRQIRGSLVARGLATDGEIDRHLANVAAGRLDLATSPMISAWGRKQA